MQDYPNSRLTDTDDATIGFLEALFDFSFSRFVSVKLVKSAYVLALLLVFVGIFYSVFVSFSSGILAGIWSLIFAPVVFLVVLTLVRVWLEFVVVVFRIADHVGKIADSTKE